MDQLKTEQRDRVRGAIVEHLYPNEIGAYRILGVIGECAMGIVYRAEQQRPRREVALKVIRAGLTHSMLRRFEYETEVLARLDHPGIARIFEAGIAETGLGPQPYFAMEFVQDARTLDKYVEESDPPVARRLELLIDICQPDRCRSHNRWMERNNGNIPQPESR